VRLKLGKVDANEEFAVVEYGAEFLNSAAGFSPTIQGFPSYPDPAASVNAVVRPGRWLELGAGLYDGATQVGCHGRTGNRGPGTLWGAPDALFLIGEARTRFRWAGRTTRLAVGAWRHTGRFAGPGETSRTGTSGFHAVLDQELLRLHAGRSGTLGLFAQLGTADGEVAAVDRHLALGLAATGLLPGRPDDVAGLLVSTVRLGSIGRHEHVIEAFYGLQLHPRVRLKPDLQFIAAPAGGAGRDTLVATLRASVTF
jgi:porin